MHKGFKEITNSSTNNFRAEVLYVYFKSFFEVIFFCFTNQIHTFYLFINSFFNFVYL